MCVYVCVRVYVHNSHQLRHLLVLCWYFYRMFKQNMFLCWRLTLNPQNFFWHNFTINTKSTTLAFMPFVMEQLCIFVRVFLREIFFLKTILIWRLYMRVIPGAPIKYRMWSTLLAKSILMRDQFDHYLNMTPVTGHSLFNSRFLFALLLIYGYAIIILNSSIEGGRAPSEVIVTIDKRQYDLALVVKRLT